MTHDEYEDGVYKDEFPLEWEEGDDEEVVELAEDADDVAFTDEE